MKKLLIISVFCLVCFSCLTGCLSSSQRVESAPTISNMIDKAKGEMNDKVASSQNAIQTNLSSLFGASIGKIGEDVAGIKATLNTTIGDISAVKAQLNTNIGEISAIKATLNTNIGDISAIKADVKTTIGDVKTDLKSQIGDIHSKVDSNIQVMNQMKADFQAKIDSLIQINANLKAELDSNIQGQAGINNKISNMKTELTNDLKAGHDVNNTQFNTEMLNALKSANHLTFWMGFLFSIIIIVICACVVVWFDRLYTGASKKIEERNLKLETVASKALGKLPAGDAKEITDGMK